MKNNLYYQLYAEKYGGQYKKIKNTFTKLLDWMNLYIWYYSIHIQWSLGGEIYGADSIDCAIVHLYAAGKDERLVLCY